MKVLNDPVFKALFHTPTPRVIVRANAPHFFVVATNNAHKTASGTLTKNLEGLPFKEAFQQFAGTNAGELTHRALIDAIKTGETVTMPPFHYNMPVKTDKAVDHQWWKLTIVPVGNDGGETEHLLIISNDISLEINKENQLKAQYRREQELVEELGATNEELVSSIDELNLSKQRLQQANVSLQKQYARLASIVGQVPAGLCILSGRNMVLENANEGMLNLWNRDASIIGKPLLDFMPELRNQAFPQILDEVFTSKIPHTAVNAEVKLVRDGVLESVYMDYSYTPLVNPEGNSESILVLAVDVTERVQSRQRERALQTQLETTNMALRERNEELTTINEEVNKSQEEMRLLNLTLTDRTDELQFTIDAAGLGTWDLDPATNRFSSNNRLKLWFGLAPDEEVDLSHALLVIAEKDRQRVVTAIANAMQHELGGNYDIEYSIVHPQTETLRFVRAIGKALFDENRKPVRFSGIIQDVTAGTKAREEIREANQRLQIALEAGKLGSYDLALDTGEVNCTPLCKQIFGLQEKDDFNFNLLPVIVVPEYVEYLQQHINNAIANKLPFDAHYQVRWQSDSSLHWIWTSGMPIYDENGKATRIIGVSYDNTNEIQTLQQLETATDTLNMALETAKIGIWKAELNSDLLILSDRAKMIIGIPQDINITQAESANFIVAEDREPVAKAYETAIRDGNDFIEEYRLQPINGSPMVWIKATGKVYYDKMGNPETILGTLIDINEEKLDNIRKNDFIGMVSHELKTPLTSVKTYIQILRSKAQNENDETENLFLVKAENQVNKMTAMIRGFLDVSRLESGKFHFEKEDFIVNTLIEEIILNTVSVTQTHHITFLPCEPLNVCADREKIGHVVENLLSNAIKYSPKGSNVQVACNLNGDQVTISICDEGIGIHASELDKLFDRFYRSQNSKAKTISGFGIGLYLSAEIVRGHDSKIWAESKEGEGATFFFTLPYKC